MPLLGALLGNAFTGLVAFLGAMVTKKVAVALALAAFLIAGWIAIQLAIKALWEGLAWTIPGAVVGPLEFAAAFLPSNFGPCVDALVLALIARWLWDRQREWAAAVAAA